MKKLLLFLLKLPFFLLGVIVIVWIALFAALQFESVQSWSMKQIFSYVEETTDLQVTIQKMGFVFPLSFYFSDVEISYHRQPLLQISELKIACPTPELLDGKLSFPSIEAKTVHAIAMPPLLGPSVTSTVPFSVSHLVIEDLHLSPSIVNQLSLSPQISKKLLESTYKVEGSIQSLPFISHLSVKTENSIVLSAQYDNQLLSLSLHASKLPLNEFIERPPLSQSIPIDLAWYAEAPLSAWLDRSIAGHFKLRWAEQSLEVHSKFLWNGEDHFDLLDSSIDLDGYKMDATLTKRDEVWRVDAHTPHGRAQAEIAFPHLKLIGKKLLWNNFSAEEANVTAYYDGNSVHLESRWINPKVDNYALDNAAIATTWDFNTLEGPFKIAGQKNEIEFDATGTGQVSLQSKVELKIDTANIKPQHLSKLPPLKAQGEIVFENGQTKILGHVQGIGSQPITIKGNLPLALNLSPWHIALEEKPMALKAQTEGDIGPFLQLFYADAQNMTGQTKISLDLAGLPSKPVFSGQLHLVNGTYESLGTGTIYTHIQAYLESDGSQLLIKDFSAKDGKQGLLSATGFMTLDSSLGYPFEIDITPAHVALLDSDFANIITSGRLKLTGTQATGKLAGDLQVDQATISIGEDNPTQIKTIDVVYINIPEGEKAPTYVPISEAAWPLELDIKVAIPGRFKINGDHLKSQWKGNLLLTGTPQNPLINGDLRVSEGNIDLQGKFFSISQGSIHFAGSPTKKTSLYIVASKDIDRIKAEIILKGPTQNPAVSFRSNPPLSEREVLSYILFGTSTSDITPDQGTQLQHSFKNLGNQTEQSSDILTKVRNNIGLDRLDIGSHGAESSDVSLQLGKYISKGILVGLNKGLNEAANSVTIEADLHKNVKAQAEVGDDGQGKILLKWKKYY